LRNTLGSQRQPAMSRRAATALKRRRISAVEARFPLRVTQPESPTLRGQYTGRWKMPNSREPVDVHLEVNTADDRVVEAVADLLLFLTEPKEQHDA
jgi:hypothetical protein